MPAAYLLKYLATFRPYSTINFFVVLPIMTV